MRAETAVRHENEQETQHRCSGSHSTKPITSRRLQHCRARDEPCSVPMPTNEKPSSCSWVPLPQWRKKASLVRKQTAGQKLWESVVLRLDFARPSTVATKLS